MPRVQPESKRMPIKWKLAILLVVFVVAAGAGAAGYWYVRDQDHKAVMNALNQRQKLVLQGKYDTALRLLAEAYPRAHSQDERQELLYYQGTTNLMKNDLLAARAAYLAYEDLAGAKFESSRQLGNIAAARGENEAAVTYYRKAADLIKNEDNPRAEDEVAALNRRIEELQQ